MKLSKAEIKILIKMKIYELHNRENQLNKELGDLDKDIKRWLFKKKKISKAISKLVNYRNKLINQIYGNEAD